MLKAFRFISLLEGMSYLLVLSITFGFISRDIVFHLGMVHGVLFMLYMIMSLTVSNSQGWSVIKWLALFTASLVPLAFIPVELILKKVQANQTSGTPASA
jgi:integral membrane protein